MSFFGGRAFIVAFEPDAPGHPQRGASGGKVLCRGKLSAMAGSAAHCHASEGYELLRYYISERDG